MIKFVHFADVHFGMENYGKVDKNTGLHSRLSDFCRSFDYLVDWSIKNKVDFVLFAGDAYKTRDPSPTYQREFSKRIKKLAESGIAIVLLVGNHDLPNAIGKANTLEIYSTLRTENIYVARQPEVLNFLKANGKWKITKNTDRSQSASDFFQVVAMPWLTKNALLSQEENEKVSVAESYQIMSEKINKIAADLKKKVSDKFPAVFLGHFSVAGAQYGSERMVYFGQDVVVSQDILASGPWQYVALGHLHKYQSLSKVMPIIYSGSIERVDFGEAKDKKGFIFGEIDTHRAQNFGIKYKFIDLPARDFVFIELNIEEGEMDINKKIIAEIKKQNIKNKILKIKLTIPEEKIGLLKQKEIAEAAKEAYYFAGIQKDLIRKSREKTLENIESLSILETLEKYWQSKKMDNKKIAEFKKYAEKLLEENN